MTLFSENGARRMITLSMLIVEIVKTKLALVPRDNASPTVSIESTRRAGAFLFGGIPLCEHT